MSINFDKPFSSNNKQDASVNQKTKVGVKGHQYSPQTTDALKAEQQEIVDLSKQLPNRPAEHPSLENREVLDETHRPDPSKIVHAEFSHVDSLPTLDKAGKALPGIQSDGLGFVNFTLSDDARFNVKVYNKEEIQTPKRSHYDNQSGFVTFSINVSGKFYSIQVKVSELADRLLTSEGRIKEEAHKGTLSEFFEKKAIKSLDLPHILSGYESLFNSQGDKVELSSKQLMKIVRSYYKSGVSENSSVNISLNKEKYDTVEVQAKRDFSGNVYLARLHDKTGLGEGGFATVYKIRQLSPDGWTDKAIKVNNAAESSIQQMLDEYEILKSAGEPVHIFVVYTKGGEVDSASISMTLYDGDVFKLIQSEKYNNASIAVKLNCCKQLVDQGLELFKKHIFHFDHKIDNVLNKEFVLKISDLGGAERNTNPKAKFSYDRVKAKTPEYIPLMDRLDGLTEKTLVYEMGATLYALLAGGRDPYTFIAQGEFARHPDPDSDFNEDNLKDYGCPKEVIEYIKEMCYQNPDHRITLEQAKQRLDDIIEKHPELSLSHTQPQPSVSDRISSEQAKQLLIGQPNSNYIIREGNIICYNSTSGYTELQIDNQKTLNTVLNELHLKKSLSEISETGNKIVGDVGDMSKEQVDAVLSSLPNKTYLIHHEKDGRVYICYKSRNSIERLELEQTDKSYLDEIVGELKTEGSVLYPVTPEAARSLSI
jgi:hypothetical protein